MLKSPVQDDRHYAIIDENIDIEKKFGISIG